jgi:hypothetical protein
MNKKWIRPFIIWAVLSVLFVVNILPTDASDFIRSLVIGIGTAFVITLVVEFCIRLLFKRSTRMLSLLFQDKFHFVSQFSVAVELDQV